MQGAQPAAITQGSTGEPTPSAPPAASPYAGLYPNLDDEYMGLNLAHYRTVSLNPLPTIDTVCGIG